MITELLLTNGFVSSVFQYQPLTIHNTIVILDEYFDDRQCLAMFSDTGRILKQQTTHMGILISALIGWLFSVNSRITLNHFHLRGVLGKDEYI